MSRGDRREDIFQDEVDRQDFLNTLAARWRRETILTVGWIARRLEMGTRKSAASQWHHRAREEQRKGKAKTLV